MTIEHLSVLKDMDGYRIEKSVDWDTLDFESLIGVDVKWHKVDGFYFAAEDAARIYEILEELGLTALP